MSPRGDSPTLTLSRALKASPERLFELWTGPDYIMRWFGGAETDIARVEVDLRVGGRYLIVMPGDEGPTEVSGSFLEIERPNRLVYTWTMRGPQIATDETTVTVEFQEAGELTQIELTHGPFAVPDLRQLHAAGWAACVDEMERILA